MSTVVIGGNSYVVYGDGAGFDVYEGAALGDGAVAWAAANATKRLQALVSAARLLDRQRWQGTPVGTPQVDVVLQWPRSGVVDAAGNPVSSASVPDKILHGAYELAASLLANPGLMTAASSGSNVRRVSPGGGVEVEFFTSTVGQSGFFPQNVADLVAEFLESGGDGTSDSAAFGTCATSQFDDCDRYDLKGV